MFKRLSDATPVAVEPPAFQAASQQVFVKRTHTYRALSSESFWNRQREGTIVLSHITVTSGPNQRGFFSCVTNEKKQQMRNHSDPTQNWLN